MNDSLITLKLSYAEITFEKYVIDDFLWVKFEKDKEIALENLENFLYKVNSKNLLYN